MADLPPCAAAPARGPSPNRKKLARVPMSVISPARRATGDGGERSWGAGRSRLRGRRCAV